MTSEVLIPISSFQVRIYSSLSPSIILHLFSNSIIFSVLLSLFLTTYPSLLLNSKFTSQVYPWRTVQIDATTNVFSHTQQSYSLSLITTIFHSFSNCPNTQNSSNSLLLLTELCEDEQSHQAQLTQTRIHLCLPFLTSYPPIWTQPSPISSGTLLCNISSCLYIYFFINKFEGLSCSLLTIYKTFPHIFSFFPVIQP